VGKIFGGPFSAASMASTCTAGVAGVTASTTIAGGQVVTLDDANGAPVTTLQLPSPRPANYTVTGTITNVNGGFKWVFNEQTVNANNSITVNAAHEYLGFSGSGPAKGDLIVGQSVCAETLAATGQSLGAGGLAVTGDDMRPFLWLAFALLTLGWVAAEMAVEIRIEREAQPE
jgi:hypothetical protein